MSEFGVVMEPCVLLRIEKLWNLSQSLWEQSSKKQTDYLSEALYSTWLGTYFIDVVDSLPDELIVTCLNNDFMSPAQALLISSHKSDSVKRDDSLYEVLNFLATRDSSEQLLEYLKLIQDKYKREKLFESFSKAVIAQRQSIDLVWKIARQWKISEYGMYHAIVYGIEHLNKQLLEVVVTKLYDQIINSVELTEFETCALLQKLFKLSPNLDQKKAILIKLKELENDIDLSELWIESGYYQLALNEVEQTYKQLGISYELDDMILNLALAYAFNNGNKENQTLYTSLERLLSHIHDAEVKRETKFLLLIGKYLTNDTEYLLRSSREVGNFPNKDEYLENILNGELSVGQYQLVLDSIDMFSNEMVRLDFLLSALELLKDDYGKELLFKSAKKILDLLSDPLDQLLGCCRLFSVFDGTDKQAAIVHIKNKFKEYFILNDFNEEEISYNPLFFPSDLSRLAIELSKIGLFNEAFFDIQIC